MKKRVGIFGLTVLSVMLFYTPDKLPEQTPKKTDNKQYTVAPISSSEIVETNTVPASTDACSEILVTVAPIISMQIDEATVDP